MTMVCTGVCCRMTFAVIVVCVLLPTIVVSVSGINGRYKLVTQQMDWASAEKHCNSMKARLAIIANATEQQAIVKYLSKFKSPIHKKCQRFRYGPYLWTAGQRINPLTKSKFVWKLSTGIDDADEKISMRNVYENDGAKVVRNCTMRYTRWARRQPSYKHRGRRESCLGLMVRKKFRWNDGGCSAKLCFVCENRTGDNCPT